MLHLAPKREFHDLRAAGEELLESQYKIQSKTIQEVFFEGDPPHIANVLLDIKLHFIPQQLFNCLQHALVPSRARLPSALQDKTLTDKSASTN